MSDQFLTDRTTRQQSRVDMVARLFAGENSPDLSGSNLELPDRIGQRPQLREARQYFLYDPKCKAKDCLETDCICWRDEAALLWRTKPKPTQPATDLRDAFLRATGQPSRDADCAWQDNADTACVSPEKC